MVSYTIKRGRNKTQFNFWKNICNIPEFKFNTIFVNLNEMYGRHKHDFQEMSYIYFFGNYKGGALCIEDDSGNIQKITEKHKLHKFNGMNYHWVEPWDGDRFSMVFYNKINPKAKKK